MHNGSHCPCHGCHHQQQPSSALSNDSLLFLLPSTYSCLVSHMGYNSCTGPPFWFSLVEKYATLGVCLCLLLFSIGMTSSCTVETDPLRAALKHWLGSHCSPSCSGSCLQDVLSAGLLQVWCLSYLFDECNSGSLGLP